MMTMQAATLHTVKGSPEKACGAIHDYLWSCIALRPPPFQGFFIGENMSTALMSKCWPITGLSCAQKSVLISLADNANDSGVCWPSISTIATRTCLTERGVQKAISELVARGVVSKQERHGRSTNYTITPELYSPPNTVHPEHNSPTPELCSPPPPNCVHPTPELCSPRTVKEPSIEPSREPSLARSRKARLPADFLLTAERIESARRYWQSKGRDDLNATEQFGQFCDHHKAKGSLMADWDAAWRTWYGNAVRFSRAPKLDPVAASRVNLEERAARFAAKATGMTIEGECTRERK